MKKQSEKTEKEIAYLRKRLDSEAKNWGSSLEKSQAKEIRLEEKLREKEEQIIALIQQVRLSFSPPPQTHFDQSYDFLL